MKTLIIIVLSIILFATPAFADWLACDAQQGITASEIEITPYGGLPVIGAGSVIVEGTILRVLNVTEFKPGRYIFRIRLKGASEWWGEWSDPFDATKPAKSGGVKIIP